MTVLGRNAVLPLFVTFGASVSVFEGCDDATHDAARALSQADDPPTPGAMLTKYVKDLNTNVAGNAAKDVSDAFDLLPAGCKIVMTMSTKSAQPACKGGGDSNDACQLPRVILVCGTAADGGIAHPQFLPSVLLCPYDWADKKNNNKVEIGMEQGPDPNTAADKLLEMADIPVDYGVKNGPYTTSKPGTDPKDVVSYPDDVGSGTKKCAFGCHGFRTAPGAGTYFGGALHNPQEIDDSFVIFSNDPDHTAMAATKGDDIDKICQCIVDNPLKDMKTAGTPGNVACRLCQSLRTYAGKKGDKSLCGGAAKDGGDDGGGDDGGDSGGDDGGDGGGDDGGAIDATLSFEASSPDAGADATLEAGAGD